MISKGIEGKFDRLIEMYKEDVAKERGRKVFNPDFFRDRQFPDIRWVKW